MSQHPNTIAEALRAYLTPRLATDPQLRALCLALGRWMVEQAELAGSGPGHAAQRAAIHPAPAESATSALFPSAESLIQSPTTMVAVPLPSADSPPVSAIISSPPAPAPHGFVPLVLGGAAPVMIEVEGTTAELGRARLTAIPTEPTIGGNTAGHSAPNLDLIERRCAVKARGCEVAAGLASMGWARREGWTSDEWMRRKYALLDEARSLPECFVFCFMPDKPLPSEPALEIIARCYDNLASAAGAARQADATGEREPVESAVKFLAEADSALRIALDRCWMTSPDRDQEAAHHWLRRKTETDRIYVERYMRLDDPADPTRWEDVRDRLKGLRERMTGAAERHKALRAKFNKVKFHAARAAQQTDSRDALDDWARIDATLRDLVSLGIKPDDARLVTALAPLADAPAPETGSPDLSLALATVRASRASADADAADTDDSPSDARPPSRTLLRVRELLTGTRMVIFGGEEYDHARERLRAAFALSEVCWVTLREHASSAPLLPEIAERSTVVVVALVKLAGHQHIEDARAWCRQHAKPLVMVKAGYNPEQVAAAILEQVADRLATA